MYVRSCALDAARKDLDGTDRESSGQLGMHLFSFAGPALFSGAFASDWRLWHADAKLLLELVVLLTG